MSVPASAPVLLVVDDEPAYLRAAVRVLRLHGYEVYGARTAHEAMHHLREGLAPDLLITNAVLPPPTCGAALASAARRLRPDLRVLFLSWLPSSPGDVGWPHLRKPYSAREIVERVRAMLPRSEATLAEL